MIKKEKIIIVGAGLAGSLLAKMLREEGFAVDVFEKRSDPRKSGKAEGRSINLALSNRGISALKVAGIFEKIQADLIPMQGRMMHDLQGNLTSQLYGKSGQNINSVSRNQLNIHLIEAAASAGVDFHFDYRCMEVDLARNEIQFEHNGKSEIYQADLIIGADGAFSVVRKAMQIQDRFSYSQHYIEHGYKELAMQAKNKDFAMDPNYLHIWPRGNFMLIALPNPDRSFTCTLFFPFEGETSFQSVKTEREIILFFNQYFPDVTERIPDFVSQFQNNPTSSLVTIHSNPWFKNRTLLIGDAAHAIVPFYGQGMNASFEDCQLFMEMAKSHQFDWDKVLSEFSKSRKPDADAISELALKNFVEMRDQVADDDFLQRKKADAEMHARFGNEWIPQYTMVTFTDIPYRDALKKGLQQEKILLQAQRLGYLSDYDKMISQVRNAGLTSQ
jgi:kynurenine 3-monooxygenase